MESEKYVHKRSFMSNIFTEPKSSTSSTNRRARPRRRSRARRQAGVEKARTAEKTQAHLSAHGSLLRPVIRHADDRRHDLRHIKRLV